MSPLLSVTDLRVRFGEACAVDGLSFQVAPGECLAIVGESGSGKSQACLSTFALSPGTVGGSALFDGEELVGAGEERLRAVRRSGVGFVFQQPLSALTPHMRIGAQLAESAGMSDPAALVRMLDEVRIGDPARRLRQYPHELSGGMRQRVMIAMAVARSPRLLIADEPTTALDAGVRREILDLLDRLRRERALAMLLISHDLGLVAGRADRVMVMRRGRAVEWGRAGQVFGRPRAHYTRRLLAASPRLDEPLPPRPAIGGPLLEARGIGVAFPVRAGLFRRDSFRAVDRASLVVREGEAVAVVGESGSGKSTLARALVRLGPVAQGELFWRGARLPERRALRAAERRHFQVVFQDPVDSLDPKMRVGDSIAEPLFTLRPDLPRAEYARRVVRAMVEVELDPRLWTRRPSQLSGGQNQRVSIARALVAEPDLLVCDEATSALDVSIQAEILDLLGRLQRRRGLALLFVSHDLAVVRRLCHRVVVMERGRIVEEGPTEAVIAAPRAEATRRLVAAAKG